MSTTFASWARTGVAAASPGLLELATDAVRLRARVRASVNGQPSKAVQLDVLGPGDVTGLAPGVIVRTDPHPGAEGFETTRFATIEFSRADLPWLFTPAAPGAGMRPWIVLVVVPATECELAPRANRPPVLTVSSTELPPPDHSWAWAHVQVPTPTGALAGPVPAGSRSRLFCPRPLRPFTRYLAAVVPAYEAGRLAGIGSEPGTVTAMAWDPANAQTVDLPAYHHWWFSTGESGDFESIARGLVALPDPPAGLGLGHLDASNPGPPTLAATNRVTDLLGPLAAQGATLGAWSPAERAALGAVLAPAPATRVLAPPTYGATAADVAGAPTTGTRRWLGQLNLHPANRAAAGAGASVVRRRQDDFVQEAWEQAGEVEAANRKLDRGRLGRRVGTGLTRRHVSGRDPVDLFGLAGPVLGRLPHRTEPFTLAGKLDATRLPRTVFDAGFRRLLRPTGPLARRGITDDVRRQMVNELGSTVLEPDRSRTGRPGGLVTMGGVLDVAAGARRSVRGGAPVVFSPRAAPTQPGADTVRVDVARRTGGAGGLSVRVTDGAGVVGATTTVRLPMDTTLPSVRTVDQLDLEGFTADEVRGLDGSVLLDLGSGLVDLTAGVREGLADLAGLVTEPPRSPAADLDAIIGQLREDLSPARAMANAVLQAVDRPDGASDVLEPVMVAPTIDEPLWDDLAELGADLFLPGADALPPEHATALATNPAFVAAFLAGANEEMMRELRWRGYPTDGRGTVFRRFWDRRSPTSDVANDLTADVDAWKGELGADVAGATGELVLVIRSDLFRRYPKTLVTAVPAIAGTPRRPDHTQATPPSFHGSLPRGVAFFGFPIPIAKAVGVTGDPTQPGWFIVFHQPPTDLGFGLDEPEPEAVGDPPTWLDPVTLGADAAAVAVAMAQLPIRLSLHVSDLVRARAVP